MDPFSGPFYSLNCIANLFFFFNINPKSNFLLDKVPTVIAAESSVTIKIKSV
jgi:hypothetical protein